MGLSVVFPSVPRSGPSSARKRSASRARENWEAQDVKEEEFADEQWQYVEDDESAGDDAPAAVTGASSGSWSTVEDPDPSDPVDIEALARNKNRHAAPIAWEDDAEQDGGGR